MLTLNRKNIVRGLVEDVLRLRLVNLDDLNVEQSKNW